MKIISAGDANRHFSSVLREVAKGETVIVTSRGKPVAAIGALPRDEPLRRAARQTCCNVYGPNPPPANAPGRARNSTRTSLEASARYQHPRLCRRRGGGGAVLRRSI